MSGLQEPGDISPDHLAAVLGALARAARLMALYSEEHPLAQEALHGALDALRPVWDATGEVALTFTDDTLCVNGEPAPRLSLAATLAQQLKRLHIVGVVLQPETTSQSLGTLLRILNAQPESVFAEGGPETALEDAVGIRLDTVSFKRFQTESDSLQLQALLKEQASSAGIQELVTTCARYLTEFMSDDEASEYSFEPSGLLAGDTAAHRNDLGTVLAMIIQRAGEGASRRGQLERWMQQTVAAVSQLPANVMADCFRAPQVNAPEYPDFLAKIGAQLPLDLAVNAVCNDPQNVPQERSDRLRRALHRLAGDGERTLQFYRGVVQCLSEAGVARDAIEMSVGLIMKSQATAERVRSQLEAMGPMRVERAQAEAGVFGQLRDQWNTTETLDGSRRTMLLELLSTQFQLSHYTELLQLLTDECHACAQFASGAAVTDILQALVDQRTAHAEGTGHQVVADRAVQEAMTPVVMDLLFGMVRAEPVPGVTDLLAQVGDAGVMVLAKVLEQDLPRPEVAAALASAGPVGAARLRDVAPRVSAGTAQALLHAATALSGEPLRRLLSAFFDHPEPSVRVATLDRTLLAGDSEVSENLVLRGLDDGDRSVQHAAVMAATATRCTSAAASLLRLMGDARADEFTQAVRRALLAVGSAEVLAGLRQWLYERGGWLRWGIERRRAAAAELLLALGSDAAIEALRPFRTDRNRAVRQVALMAPVEAIG